MEEHKGPCDAGSRDNWRHAFVHHQLSSGQPAFHQFSDLLGPGRNKVNQVMKSRRRLTDKVLLIHGITPSIIPISRINNRSLKFNQGRPGEEIALFSSLQQFDKAGGTLLIGRFTFDGVGRTRLLPIKVI